MIKLRWKGWLPVSDLDSCRYFAAISDESMRGPTISDRADLIVESACNTKVR